jgi:hypothetical protein
MKTLDIVHTMKILYIGEIPGCKRIGKELKSWISKKIKNAFISWTRARNFDPNLSFKNKPSFMN